MGKTVPSVLGTALGLRPRAVLKTSGTVFPNTDRPRPANNIYVFATRFQQSRKEKQRTVCTLLPKLTLQVLKCLSYLSDSNRSSTSSKN